MRTGSARLQVLAAAVLFSTGGAGIKAAAFSGIQVSALRSGVATIALVLLARRRLVLSPRVIGVGVVYGATLTLFVLATKLTTAANAIFFQSTAPLYLLLLSPWLLGERFRRRDVLYLAGVGLGLIFCFLGQPVATTTAPNPTLGNTIGVACSIVWALTLLGLRYLEKHSDRPGTSVDAVIAGNFLASVAALPFAWPMPQASALEWATIGYLGVFQIAVAYVFLTNAVRNLSALEVSLLLLLEPVLNPAWTWLIRGEHPGEWTIAGGVIIIAATAIKSVYETLTTGQRPQSAATPT